MARGVNKAIVLGNCTKDPDVKYAASGAAIVNVTVATNESWVDKNTQQKVEKAEFHRIVVFGKLAEICAQYLKKGSQVYFEGKIQTTKYQDQSGQDKYSTEIVAKEMQLLGGNTGSSAPPQSAPARAPERAAPAAEPEWEEPPF